MLKSLDRFYIKVMAASLPAMRVYQACMASAVGKVFGQETKDHVLQAQAAVNACIRTAETKGQGCLELHEQLMRATYPLARHVFSHLAEGVLGASEKLDDLASAVEEALEVADQRYL